VRHETEDPRLLRSCNVASFRQNDSDPRTPTLFSIRFPIAFVFPTTLIFPMPFAMPDALRPTAKVWRALLPRHHMKL
jgi:hypothetical protein